MKKLFTILTVALLITVIIPAAFSCSKPAAEVAESPSEFELSGTMETIKSLTDPNPKIENFIWIGRNTEYWEVHGGLEGRLAYDDVMEVDTLTGKFTTNGVGTFTGEVEGKSGSYVFSSVGSGQFTSLTGESGTATSENTIISGTGELANLRGSLHSESKFDKNGTTGSYSGTCRFVE